MRAGGYFRREPPARNEVPPEDPPDARPVGDDPLVAEAQGDAVLDGRAGQRESDDAVPDADGQHPQGAAAPDAARHHGVAQGGEGDAGGGALLPHGVGGAPHHADTAASLWKAKTMRASGVTYSDLREAGMTHETMGLFPFTLYEWSTLGFSRTDAEAVPAHVLGRLFGMTKPDVLRCLV